MELCAASFLFVAFYFMLVIIFVAMVQHIYELTQQLILHSVCIEYELGKTMMI